MDIRWSRWKVWILFLLVVVVTAIVIIPRAEGAGMDRSACGHSSGSDLSHQAGEIIDIPVETLAAYGSISIREMGTIRSTV